MSEAIYGIEPDQIEAAVRKLKKESENYAKMDVFGEFGVDWGDREAALWELVRQGHYDAWNDPAIWSELTGERGLAQASAEDLVDFLARVEHYDEQKDEADADLDEPGFEDAYNEAPFYYDGGGYEEPAFESARLVSFWPAKLDVMAMHAYAQDDELVEARAGEFAPEVQKGLQLVRRRFGKIERDDLPADTVASLASTHVWKSLPWHVWDVVDGELTKLEIGRQDGDGPAQRRQFLSNFVDQDTWAEAVLEAIFEGDYGPSFEKTHEAWPQASLEQLEWMLSNISAYNQDRVRAYELVLGRDDSPEELLDIARNLSADARHSEAEFAAICAALRAKALGEDAPEEALELISFETIDNPTSRDGYHSLPQLTEALHTFDDEAAVARFFAVFDDEYRKSYPFPALKAYPEHGALLDTALQTVEVLVDDGYESFGSMNKVAFGLAMLGPDALAPLAKAVEATGRVAARNTYRRAILGILADADEAQAPKFDRFVSLAHFEDDDSAPERDLGYYTAPDYRAALAKLPEERAVARVLEDFDESPRWHRALAALEELAAPELLERAFDQIGRHGLPATDGHDWFRPLLQSLRDEVGPYLGPALAASDSTEFHNTVKRELGEETYQTLLDEAGGTSAADKGPVDKIRRLSKAVFETQPDQTRATIYVFEKLDEGPGADTLNRVGGRPFGVTADSWPHKDDDPDSPMQHMVTLDLDSVPALRRPFEDEVRALALYVYNPPHNKAWTPGNADARVETITRDEMTEFDGELPVGDEDARGFAVHEVEVPAGVFTVPYDGDEDLRRVRGAIYGTNAWGGSAPMWLQGDEYLGVFVMQFDEGFVPMNLGDCGIMYVFADAAFWQCH